MADLHQIKRWLAREQSSPAYEDSSATDRYLTSLVEELVDYLIGRETTTPQPPVSGDTGKAQ